MTTIKLRRGTAAQWTTSNPVLEQGEPGFEQDTGKHKIGDGTSTWSQLKYFLNELGLNNAIDARAVNRANFSIFPVEDYDPTVYSSSDGGPAVQAAIDAAIAAGGGTVAINRPVTYTTPIHCKDTTVPVTFRGPGTASQIGLQQRAALIYAGTGSATAFDCSNSSGLSFEAFSLRYSNGAFTGGMLDFKGGVDRDGSLHKLRDMLIRPNGTLDSHAWLVRLDKCHTIDIVNCHLIGSKALYGKSLNSNYANAIKVSGGWIQGRTTEPVWNPDLNWVFDRVTFEPLTSGAAGASNHDAGVLGRSVHFRDCYFGDDTAAGAWVTYAGTSLTIDGGGILTARFADGAVVRLDANNCADIKVSDYTSYHVVGSAIIDLGSTTGHTGIYIGPHSDLDAVPRAIKGTVPDGTVVWDRRNIPNLYGPVLPTGAQYGASNMLTAEQADPEVSVGYVVNSNISSTVISTDQAMSGTHSIKLTAAATVSDTSILANPRAVGVKPGQVYTALIHTRAATVPRGAYVAIYWYDATDSIISSTSGAVVVNSTGGWSLSYCTATAPVTAVRAAPMIRFSNMAAGEVQYIDCIQLAPGKSLVWNAVASQLSANLVGSPLVLTRRIVLNHYPLTLASNGAVAFDSTVANSFTVNLAANATSSTLTGGVGGQVVTLEWSQDATGGRTYVWPTNCRFAGGSAPSDTTASKRTSVTFRYDDAASLWIETGRSVAVG